MIKKKTIILLDANSIGIVKDQSKVAVLGLNPKKCIFVIPAEAWAEYSSWTKKSFLSISFKSNELFNLAKEDRKIKILFNDASKNIKIPRGSQRFWDQSWINLYLSKEVKTIEELINSIKEDISKRKEIALNAEWQWFVYSELRKITKNDPNINTEKLLCKEFDKILKRIQKYPKSINIKNTPIEVQWVKEEIENQGIKFDFYEWIKNYSISDPGESNPVIDHLLKEKIPQPNTPGLYWTAIRDITSILPNLSEKELQSFSNVKFPNHFPDRGDWFDDSIFSCIAYADILITGDQRLYNRGTVTLNCLKSDKKILKYDPSSKKIII